MDGAGASGFGTSEEEPVLFPDGGGADGVLDEIVVDLHLGVFGIQEQFVPEIEGVVDRFSGQAFGSVYGLFGSELKADSLKDWNTFFLTDDMAVEFGVVAQLGLNPDEYLRDILPRLPHMTNHTAKNYTPAAWKASREIQ